MSKKPQKASSKENLTFRPHHFLCTLCFQGKGYSPDFIRNYKSIVRDLKSDTDDEILITVTPHTDSICSACPSKVDLLCKTQEKIDLLDKAHAAALALNAGETLTWTEAKQRIKERMTLEQFHKICEPCSWKAYGLCEVVLTEFLKK
ncbi:MAG: DUF1284 domain-containing protein [Gammaproteobacteria bacterium]|nr:DUF1284 domain-containing protein [Gammaproteobacteria bacterium]